MESVTRPMLAYQPGRIIFTIFAVLFTAVRIPLWIIYFMPSSLRQNPNWSFRQAVRVRLLRTVLYNLSLLKIKTPMSLNAGKEGSDWVVIPPADSSVYIGPTSKDPEVTPQKIGCTWYPKPLQTGEKPSGLVVLHFHGGAYVIGDGRKADAGYLAKVTLNNTPASHVLCPSYRLASHPGNRFPSQLQDAITSYFYLTKTIGVDPKKVVFAGDSAGGNLALALLRYVEEHGPTVGLSSPGAAVLWSPWVAPVKSYNDPDDFYRSPNHKYDYVNSLFGLWGASSYKPNPSTGLTLGDPFISFLGNAFKTTTPICISTGECEVLFHDNCRLAEQMKAVAGNTVELQIQAKAVHDIILLGDKIGFDEEANLAATQVGEFLKKSSSSKK